MKNLDQFERTLDTIESYARLVREDVASKDAERASLGLESIELLVGQLRMMLADGPNGKSRKRIDGGKLKAAVITILQENGGGPMRVKDITEALREKGVELPGQQEAANLISHMRRWKEVERPEYGMYQLSKKK